MAFSKAMTEAFRVTLFNGSRDNDEVKKPRSHIEKSDTNSFWHGFTENHLKKEIMVTKTRNC